MSKLNTRQDRMFVLTLHLAGLSVVVLSALGFYGLILEPLKQKQSDYRSKSEQVDFLLLKTGSEGTEYRRLREELQSMTDSIAELRRQLAEQGSETVVIEQLTELAERANLEVLDYQVGITSNLPTHSKTEVELSCHGSYASICHFLQEAEQITKTTKLSKFELRSDENLNSYPIQLTFVLYSDGKSNDTKEKRGVL